jgi:hypothetical protein
LRRKGRSEPVRNILPRYFYCSGSPGRQLGVGVVMIIVPPPDGHPWEWLAGLVVGVILIILLLPFLDRYVGPIVDRYWNWIGRRFH